MTLSTIIVQTTPEAQPSTPHWMGEVAAFAQILSQTGILAAITDQVRFARARMGTYELIDFVVVLIGYALSGEPTLASLLRASGAVCQRVYGPVWPPALALALRSVPLCRRAGSG